MIEILILQVAVDSFLSSMGIKYSDDTNKHRQLYVRIKTSSSVQVVLNPASESFFRLEKTEKTIEETGKIISWILHESEAFIGPDGGISLRSTKRLRVTS